MLINTKFPGLRHPKVERKIKEWTEHHLKTGEILIETVKNFEITLRWVTRDQIKTMNQASHAIFPLLNALADRREFYAEYAVTGEFPDVQ